MRRTLALIALAVRFEIRLYAALIRLVARRPDVPEGATAVRYVGAVAALLWGFTVVSVVELVALHLIIPWETVRLVADVLGIWGVIWCLGFTAAHYVYPHLATTESLELRLQRRQPTLTLPWDAVESAGVRERSLDSGKGVQVHEEAGRVVASVVVGQRTNVDLRLSRPVPVTVSGVVHEVREVRVYVDEPRAVLERRAITRGGGGTPRREAL